MAFCFKRRESVPKAVRRLALERIGSALGCLKDWRRPEAIHEARKDLKKLRALLRLVRTRISPKVRRPLARTLREAAGRLAGPRDAVQEVHTLEALRRRFRRRLAPGSLGHVGKSLRSTAREAERRFAQEQAAGSVSQKLRRAGSDFKTLKLRGSGWKLLGPGLKAAYTEGRRAYQHACTDGSAETLHRWRKRAKDLWYQVCLLRPVQPRWMDATATELEALGEHLGDDHDLVMLGEAARAHCTGGAGAAELDLLAGLIEERRCELRAAALALGSRAYAEPPGRFCRRLEEFWHAWRTEKEPRHRPANAPS